VVRTRTDPARLLGTLRTTVLAVEPDLPLAGAGPWTGFGTLDDFLSRGRASRTLQTALLAGFAVAALLLAVIGLWGIVAYAVTQRRREIAVRVVLGADQRGILRLVLGRTLVLCALGILGGAIGAALLTRVMAGLLFGVGPTDPATFVAVVVLLVGVTLVAGWLPARRATRVDPMLSLRAE
jgi:ABC-type antimicrobial peptide transport system permease subunit